MVPPPPASSPVRPAPASRVPAGRPSSRHTGPPWPQCSPHSGPPAPQPSLAGPGKVWGALGPRPVPRPGGAPALSALSGRRGVGLLPSPLGTLQSGPSQACPLQPGSHLPLPSLEKLPWPVSSSPGFPCFPPGGGVPPPLPPLPPLIPPPSTRLGVPLCTAGPPLGCAGCSPPPCALPAKFPPLSPPPRIRTQ